MVKYLTKVASAEEEAELLEWLSQGEDNRKQFRSLKDAFDLGQFEFLVKSSDTEAEWKKLLRKIKPAEKPIFVISRKILRYAAVFVLGLLCMKAVESFLNKEQTAIHHFTAQVETGKGERSKITLPDNTTVWLNACSSISYDYDFGKQTRTVFLNGEAFFDVHKDASTPFVVSTENMTCRVTGTLFNVYAFGNDNIESVVLVDGAVTIEIGDYSIDVNPGELFEFDKETRRISSQQTNTDIHTGWRYGELMFEQMSFEELAKRLERNFYVTFVFENESVKRKSFGGTFRQYDSLETILKVISASAPIRYSIERDTVYIR